MSTYPDNNEDRPILHVGFTGTRRTPPSFDARFEEVRRTLEDLVFQDPWYRVIAHHGGCVGADYRFHQIAEELAELVIVHPPINQRHAVAEDTLVLGIDSMVSIRKRKEYIERNHDIVNESSMLIAVPKRVDMEELRSGTWATIRYARKAYSDDSMIILL